MFDSYELLDTSEEKTHDYMLKSKTPSGDTYETFKAWEVYDEKFLLAVEDDAPEEAVDIAEKEGWEVVDASELNKEKTKTVNAEVKEDVKFYVEDPPENRFVSIIRNNAREFLENRGVLDQIGRLEHCWYYPEKDEFVALYTSVDQSGEAATVLWTASEISEDEKRIIFNGETDESETDKRSIDELSNLIYEKTTVSKREAQILSCYLYGIDSHTEMSSEIGDVQSNSISSSAYHLEEKIQGMGWLFTNVIAHIEDDNLPDEIVEMIDSVESGNPIEKDEVEISDDVHLR